VPSSSSGRRRGRGVSRCRAVAQGGTGVRGDAGCQAQLGEVLESEATMAIVEERVTSASGSRVRAATTKERVTVALQ
jgi:hypothetical protein